ncbi:MAG: 2-phosphosulfolactate phosphatase [Candidatus Levybacteria bacterium]|nr:2-phosphosulfolactate phosphatase [Candidatus Levybacteria bacterium]
MKVNIIHDAKQAKGLAVIIDILRAATVEAFILGNNANCIIPVKTSAEAFALREKNPRIVLIGESNGLKIEGFDYGNSPSEIKNVNFEGKIVVHRSSHGTQGLVDAQGADQVIFGSFVTFSAIKKFIEKTNPKVVSLVPTLDEGDDELFANYLYRDLYGYDNNFEEVKERTKGLNSIFLDPEHPEFPEEDFHLALTLDTFPFLCITDKKDDQLIVKKQEV